MYVTEGSIAMLVCPVGYMGIMHGGLNGYHGVPGGRYGGAGLWQCWGAGGVHKPHRGINGHAGLPGWVTQKTLILFWIKINK
jgi:hypothetical protein